jgi:hypothetical protein
MNHLFFPVSPPETAPFAFAFFSFSFCLDSLSSFHPSVSAPLWLPNHDRNAASTAHAAFMNSSCLDTGMTAKFTACTGSQ